MSQRERTTKALNIVAKWRKLFAGWQLGTRKLPEAAETMKGWRP